METTSMHNELIKYITNELEVHKRPEIEEWIDSSAENKREYLLLKQVWEGEINDDLPDFDTDKALNKVNIALDATDNKQIGLKKILYVAASILLLVSLTYLGYRYIGAKRTGTNTIVVETFDTKKNISLPDGTKVWLNKNSRLEYTPKYAEKERRVVLMGEGYFEVKSNPDKPFVVYSKKTYTKVLGTAFNVKAYHNQAYIEVTVNEGRVELGIQAEKKDKSKKTVQLNPGEKGKYTEDEKSLIKEKNNDTNFDAWKTNTLKFKEIKLKDAIKDLSDYYKVPIVIEDSALATKRFTSTFKNRELEDVFAIIELTMDVKVTESDGLYKVEK